MKTIKEGFLRKNLGLGKEELIRKWLDEHKIINYIINKDLTIDVDGDVDLYKFTNEEFPSYIQFGIINDGFNIRFSNMTSLRGCPKEVGGNFRCNNCSKLKSLEGAPKEVGGNFNCSSCPKLESLVGAPEIVGGDFNCGYCFNLTSLEGAPKKVGGGFYCYNCYNLTSLEGCPQKVDDDFVCSNCFKLTSLEGCPQKVSGAFSCITCGERFTKDDVEKVSKVKGKISV